jgi:tetratricopeptide (TPR) repeat protein
MERRVLGEEGSVRVGPVIWIVVAVLITLGVAVGCGFGDPYVSVVEGNYAYGQGRYQDSTVHYLQAISKGSYGDWISYDLGNVYHSLGESDAALQMWRRAAASNDTTLRYGTSYNLGVQYYELGDYEKAYNSFRKALEYNPSSINAKVNLELSLRKLQPTTDSSSFEQPKPSDKPAISEQDSRRVLDYVRRKEAQEWVPGKTQAPESAPDDW